MNCFYNLHCRLFECLFCFFRRNLDGLGQTCYQVTSSDFHVVRLRSLISGTDFDLDILCGAFTDQKVMLLSHVADNRFVKIIACDLDGCAHHGSSQRNYRNIGRTAADIHDHVAARSGNIDTSSDCSRNRFFNNRDLSCACLIGCILNSFLLYLSYAAGYADCDSGAAESLSAECFLDEVFHHLLCYGIVRNNALTKRTDCYDIAGRTSQHQARVLSNCLDLVGITVKCYNGRLL